MARPKKKRIVGFEMKNKFFKPNNYSLMTADIKTDELEAMRLCDMEELFQEIAAKKMGVSRRTLERILFSGRKKIADALLNGKSIKISKPDYVSTSKGGSKK